jgi:transposase
MQWDVPTLAREQMILFPTSLDDAVPHDAFVRDFDAILRELDWAGFEAEYHPTLGASAMHPRVVASVILFGHIVRIRSSRQLEAALELRVDFKWLVEGRTFDHTTISRFRKKFGDQLVDLGAQMAVMAHLMGATSLTTLGFDGTRIRSNNHRQRSVNVEDLEQLEEQLKLQFEELEQQVQQHDARDDAAQAAADEELLALKSKRKKTQNRLEAVRKAKAERDRAKAAGEAVPKRLPLTDVESRITPNKEGGFAPNMTPTAMVDLESGLILESNVIAGTEEEQCLVPSVEAVESSLKAAGLDVHVDSVAADGKFTTGPNLEAMAARGTAQLSPIGARPACVTRPDGSVPIPESEWDSLPTRTSKKGKDGAADAVQFTSEAFLYDSELNCFWCPQGECLSFTGKTSEMTARKAPSLSRRVERRRFAADPTSCADCPMKSRCLSGQSTRRTLSVDQYEHHRDDLRERMQDPANQEQLKTRQTAGERPFGTIKQVFGARQFLLRGLAGVRAEWRWLTTAFNMTILSRLRRNAEPGSPSRSSPSSVGVSPGIRGGPASPDRAVA